MSTRTKQTLVSKIQSLPAEHIAEVEAFVDFLKQRAQLDRSTRRKPLDFPVIDVGK